MTPTQLRFRLRDSGQTDLFATPLANEHGVVEDDAPGVERISDDDKRGGKPYWGWEVLLLQFPDGLWRYGSTFMSGELGWAHPLGEDGPGFSSREAAIEAFVRLGHERLRGGRTPVVRRALRDFEAMLATFARNPERVAA